MFDERINQIEIDFKFLSKESNPTSIKTVQRYMAKIKTLNKLITGFMNGEFHKGKLPYYPKSISKFCEWKDEANNLESFGRTQFIAPSKSSESSLIPVRRAIKVLVDDQLNELVKLAKASPSATASLERNKKALADSLRINKGLVSQLAKLRHENKNHKVRIRSLETLTEKLQNELERKSTVSPLTLV